MLTCPLCNLAPSENIHFESERLIILDTKEKKGHFKRIMVITKKHKGKLNLRDRKIFEDFCLGFFDEPFTIMSDQHSKLPNHSHLVASDLREAEDTRQILRTKRTIYR